MSNTNHFYHCLNCNRSETEIPLVALRHNQKAAWICSQCLPILIHHPQQLVGKLSGANKLEPAPPDDQ